MSKGVIRTSEAFVVAAGAVILSLTALSQHPNRAFDRLRACDPLGTWIPNWRFFAPHPAQHDFHVLHRTLDTNECESPWEETHTITPRRLRHALWFPERRVDKAIFDVVGDLMQTVHQGTEVFLASPTHNLLCEFVRHRINQKPHKPLVGFQYMIASSDGYNGQHVDETLVTPLIPW